MDAYGRGRPEKREKSLKTREALHGVESEIRNKKAPCAHLCLK